MFEKIPIQRRWRIIHGLIAFAFLVSLAYAVQTWNIYARVEELEAKTAVIEDADMEIVNRQVQLKQLTDNIRGSQSRDSLLNTHVQLMQYMEHHCDLLGLRLIQLPKESIQDVEGYQIAAIDFSVQGSFQNILELIYQMEAKDRVGTIAHADLELKAIRTSSDRQTMLVGTLRLNRLVQSPNSTPHEAS